MTSKRKLAGLSALEKVSLWKGTLDFNLEIPRKLLSALGNPQNELRVIHIGGTNGKGSVSAMIAAGLIAAGHRVGQFTSPHLSSITERCLIDGNPVFPEILNQSLEVVFQVAEDLEIEPSYFELITAATFLTFVKEKVDYAVIEVGLGGRLDATNTVERPLVSVITGVDFDHTHILGESLEEIAGEKAGIFRSGVQAVIGKVPMEVKKALIQSAEEIETPIKFVGERERLDSKLGLLGEHQISNSFTAIQVLECLGVSKEHIREGLERVRWPGRLEEIEHQGKRIILDCAHNPGGMKVLCDFLKDRNPVFLLSILERKDWRRMLSSLPPDADVVFTQSSHKSALAPETLQEELGRGQAITDSNKALSAALSSLPADGSLVIAGSIYLVGELREKLLGDEFSTYK